MLRAGMVTPRLFVRGITIPDSGISLQNVASEAGVRRSLVHGKHESLLDDDGSYADR